MEKSPLSISMTVARRPAVDAEEARRLLSYDPQTGLFTWKVGWGNKKRPVGSIASRARLDGYHHVKIYERLYKAHRLAWLIVYGEWPEGDLDHKNNDRADNRIDNLRLATPSLNACNRSYTTKSGLPRGVDLLPGGRYRAKISKLGKRYHLGVFDDAASAHAAYCAKAVELYGDFARAV